ncbi:MAG: hypothetical protein R3C20_07310 [Planctomycetaceae bacterium]
MNSSHLSTFLIRVLSIRILVTAFLLILFGNSASIADEPSGASGAESVRRQTAVTLNYCRAALHRIRRAPGKDVVVEEQQRILNNLDLNQIDDPEVISLYRAILDEIGQLSISERERTVIDEQFRRGMQRKMGTEIFVIGAQVATGQLGSVIQSGANSWWDYRSTQIKRDSDLWNVEKSQFSGLMNRSSTFLDSFWRLSRKNDIPDRWLLRDQDLDQLSDVLSEPDGERRLRMLGRLEKFMECYPPYWYYVARTQQQLGQLDEARRTYLRLAEIGDGHFRQDDMMASSMANLSLILEQNGDQNAVAMAQKAYDYSNRNWEANLVCAWVLGRHQKYRDAEDLILCNMDYKLENDQSTIALVSLYYHSDDKARLAELLENESIVARVPIPGLLLCAKSLGPDQLPRSAQHYLSSTLVATRRFTGGRNAISLAAVSGWKLADAEATFSDGESVFHTAGYRPTPRGLEMNFVPRAEERPSREVGENSSSQIRLTLNYQGTPAIHVIMSRPNSQENGDSSSNRRQGIFNNPLSSVARLTSAQPYYIQEIEVDGLRLSFSDGPEAIPAAEASRNRRAEILNDLEDVSILR